MTDPAEPPRRFYKTASLGEGADPVILLDGRKVRTPAGAVLAAPTRALAEILAGEWNAQGEAILAASMPATRLAFTALDRVAQARAEVAQEVARYAGADLLCYFADRPQALRDLQARAWGPWLDWARDELGLRFVTTSGVVHAAQLPGTLERVAVLAGGLDDFALTGLAHATALFGSAVLAFALQRGAVTGEAAFALSQLDEDFQAEQWGVDAEAAARRVALQAEAEVLGAWFRAL